MVGYFLEDNHSLGIELSVFTLLNKAFFKDKENNSEH